MIIAKQKRKDNIAEYIIYLWQLEDLLRALNFDAGRIYTTLVEPHTELDQEQKEMLLFWYIDMVNLLKSEGKAEIGHLEHTIHLISDLNELHLRLLAGLEEGEVYREKFALLKSELPKIRVLIKERDISDIELCFRVLYAVMLERLKGEDKTFIKDTLELISPVIALLASLYKKVEKGKIDLFK